MVDKIIAVDFNGALLQSRPFDEAHKKWFYVMSNSRNNVQKLQNIIQ